MLAQYYNFVRFGREGYTYVLKGMQKNTRALAKHLGSSGDFELIGDGEEQLPLVAFKLAEKRAYDEFDIAWQLSAERGWMVPAYTLPPDAQDVTIMRALVKETLGLELVDTLAADIAQACKTLDAKGGAHAIRARADQDRDRLLTDVAFHDLQQGGRIRDLPYYRELARQVRLDPGAGSRNRQGRARAGRPDGPLGQRCGRGPAG